MRRLPLILGMLCCSAAAAMAGPNAGGVLWVHDIGYIYCFDSFLPPPSVPPVDCASVDNEQPVNRTYWSWKVYAAFPPTSSPRLKGLAWGTQFPEAASSPYSYVWMALGGCGVPDEDGPGTDFWIGTGGFPVASGGEIGQSFPTGPRITTVVELFYFTGSSYSYAGSGEYPTWCTVPYSDPTQRYFVDDASPGNADPIMGYGCLGFGIPGYTPCPVAPDPTGACCNTATGACTITTQAACLLTWLGEGVPCNDVTCVPPVPTERVSWSQIKILYR
jgi:hypothetical protein